MYKLDNQQRENLFYLINFLCAYHRSSHEKYQEIFSLYRCLMRDIHQTKYIVKAQEINDYNTQTIDLFKELPKTHQDHIINLAKFLIYYQYQRSKYPDFCHPLWKPYTDLVKTIKDSTEH